MKLSEAIRLGAMLKPQSFYDYEIAGGTCAIGAALDAIGALSSFDDDAEFFPILRREQRDVQCPACRQWLSYASGVIVHLNDAHHWTRERIADWVETVEAAQELEAPASTNAVDPSAADHGTPTPRDANVSALVRR